MVYSSIFWQDLAFYVGIILVTRVYWQQFRYSSGHKLSSALPAHLDHKYSCKHGHIFCIICLDFFVMRLKIGASLRLDYKNVVLFAKNILPFWLKCKKTYMSCIKIYDGKYKKKRSVCISHCTGNKQQWNQLCFCGHCHYGIVSHLLLLFTLLLVCLTMLSFDDNVPRRILKIPFFLL